MSHYNSNMILPITVLQIPPRLPVEWFSSWLSSLLHTPSILPGWQVKPTPLPQLFFLLVEAMAAASSLMTSERHTTGSATTPLRSVVPIETKKKVHTKLWHGDCCENGFLLSQDAKVMSWWDYGYQITAMANRTILVDNNTWNNTHISRVGQVSIVPFKIVFQNNFRTDYRSVLLSAGHGIHRGEGLWDHERARC